MTLSIKLTNLHNISKETTKRKERDSSVEENTTDTTKPKENDVIVIDDLVNTTIDVKERKQGSYGVYVRTYEDDDVQIVPGPIIDSYTLNYLKSKLYESIPKYAKAAIIDCLRQFKEENRAFEVGSDLIIQEEAFGSLIMNRDMVKGRTKGSECPVKFLLSEHNKPGTIQKICKASLRSINYQLMQRTQPNLSAYRKILSVVKSGQHWYTVELDFRESRISIYDSLSSDVQGYAQDMVLFSMWVNAARARYGFPAVKFGLAIESCRKQNNGYDCGIFAIEMLKALTLGLEPTITGLNATEHRWKIAYELLAGDISPVM